MGISSIVSAAEYIFDIGGWGKNIPPTGKSLSLRSLARAHARKINARASVYRVDLTKLSSVPFFLLFCFSLSALLLFLFFFSGP